MRQEALARIDETEEEDILLEKPATEKKYAEIINFDDYINFF